MHTTDRSCRYYIQDVFFWRLAGPVAPTGKSNCPLDRVLTYKNLIYLLNLQVTLYFVCIVCFSIIGNRPFIASDKCTQKYAHCIVLCSLRTFGLYNVHSHENIAYKYFLQ